MLPILSSAQATTHLAVFGVELALTFTLIYWMRSAERGRQEPWSFVLSILFYGALIALISAFVEIKYSFNIPFIQKNLPHLYDQYGSIYEFINNISASLIEELAKYMVAVFTVVNTRHFHKMSDAIVYLIFIGLGFSLIEDAIFFLNPDTNAPLRLLTFYVHSGTSAIIGYSLGRYKFGLAGYSELLRAILGAIGLHAAYNITTTLDNQDLGFYLTIFITLYITLQVFILFRRALGEEYNLEHQSTRVRHHTLLNLKPK